MIVDPDLPTHRKTLKAAALLRVNRDAVVVMLVFMWGHCQQRRDDLLGHDDADLAACCQWAGPAKKLRAVLEDCVWIDKTERGWIAHGWRERNASWLSRIEGGRKRHAHAARDTAGRLLAGETPASSQLAGPGAGRVEWSGVEKSTSTLPAAARSREASDSETLLLAKKRMCGVLGLDPSRGWSPDAEQSLSGLVPIPEKEWKAVEWLHRQPADNGKRPKLRISPTTLTRHWSDEVSKAIAFAAECGVDFEVGEKKKAGATDPDGWGEWLARKGYPPVPYAAAERSVRAEFCEKNDTPAEGADA